MTQPPIDSIPPEVMDEVQERLSYVGPLTFFPWHEQQKFALALATDTVVVLGGNQSGKTTVAAGIVDQVVRRDGPIYRRLRNATTRPLKIWVSPQLHEKYLSHWEPRLRQQVFHGIEHHYVETPHPVYTWDDECAVGNTLWGKSQEQGYLAFESDEVDLIVFDEEPLDPRLFTSAQQRLSTTNGVIVFAFTPLQGLSWTYGPFYVLVCRPGNERAPRVWVQGTSVSLVQMGMADNPAAIEGGGVDRLKTNVAISEAERRTRLLGEYGFAEGLVWPEFADLIVGNARSPYIIPTLPMKGRAFSWVLVADPNKRHGALLAAIDQEGNRFYAAEHYLEAAADSKHAAGYRDMIWLWRTAIIPGWTEPKTDTEKARLEAELLKRVDCWADPGGAGAQAIINLAEVGIYAKPVPKDAGSVAASIKRLRRAAAIDATRIHPWTGQPGSPAIFFLSTLRSVWVADGVPYAESRLMWELRQYRQDPNRPPDTPVKDKDDLTDCGRYLELVRPWTPTPPDLSQVEERAKLDQTSQKAAREFDELVAAAERRRRPKSGDNW